MNELLNAISNLLEKYEEKINIINKRLDDKDVEIIDLKKQIDIKDDEISKIKTEINLIKKLRVKENLISEIQFNDKDSKIIKNSIDDSIKMIIED